MCGKMSKNEEERNDFEELEEMAREDELVRLTKISEDLNKVGFSTVISSEEGGIDASDLMLTIKKKEE